MTAAAVGSPTRPERKDARKRGRGLGRTEILHSAAGAYALFDGPLPGGVGHESVEACRRRETLGMECASICHDELRSGGLDTPAIEGTRRSATVAALGWSNAEMIRSQIGESTGLDRPKTNWLSLSTVRTIFVRHFKLCFV